jgi:hypothetical protein
VDLQLGSQAAPVIGTGAKDVALVRRGHQLTAWPERPRPLSTPLLMDLTPATSRLSRRPWLCGTRRGGRRLEQQISWILPTSLSAILKDNPLYQMWTA